MFDLSSSPGKTCVPLLATAAIRPQLARGAAPNSKEATCGSEACDGIPDHSPPIDDPPKTEGWLIEGAAAHPEGRKGQAPRRRFLQIGTGQWCGAQYATRFPRRSTALAYAREFGLLVEPVVKIVRYPDDAKGFASQVVSRLRAPSHR